MIRLGPEDITQSCLKGTMTVEVLDYIAYLANEAIALQSPPI